MSAGPDGLDQSWGVADPAKAAAAGIKVVAMYLSWDQSKNMTPAKVKAYHQHGIAVLLNWESQAGAPLNGASQGHADALEAVRQAEALEAAVGYGPKNIPTIYFSCDTDVSASQFAKVGAYYTAAKAVCNAAGFHAGVYGEADLVDYLASHGITQGEWQTYAWPGGRLSSYADFYQFQNNMSMGGASVDYDRVLHAGQLGAWWPPGSAHDKRPSPKPTTPAQPVTPAVPVKTDPTGLKVGTRTLTDADLAAVVEAMWEHGLVRLSPEGEHWSRPAGDRLVDLATVRDNVAAILALLKKEH